MARVRNIKGTHYLCFGMILFVVFVLTDTITQLVLGCVFGGTFINWQYSVQILSKVIPAILWLILFLFANKIASNKLNLNLMKKDKNISFKKYLVIAIFLVTAIMLNYLNWGGFKLLIEYQNAGMLGFIAQHIYYFCEIIIVSILIIIFQKMCEAWFHKTAIPYGGIIVAITWGLSHIFTQNSLLVGSLAFIYGFGFGSTYLILNRNFKLTVICLFLMFIL